MDRTDPCLDKFGGVHYLGKKRTNQAKDEKEKEERNVFSRSHQKWDMKSQFMFTL